MLSVHKLVHPNLNWTWAMTRLAWMTVNLKLSNAKIYYPICKINSDIIKNQVSILAL